MLHPQTLVELVEGAERAYERRLAYTWRPGLRAQRFTFGDVARLARRYAAELQRRGVGAGDRVLLWAPNSPLWVAAFFGCQLKGAVAVPLIVQNTPEFAARIAALTGARLVLGSAAVRLPGCTVPCVPLAGLLEHGAGPGGFAPGAARPDDVCQILFTSGTTGNPKGVVLRHRNVVANLRDVQTLQLIDGRDRLLSILPLAHAFEQIATLFLAMSVGASVTHAASLAGTHIRMNMVDDHPTVMVVVPEFLKLAVQQVEAKAAEQGRAQALQRLFHLGPRLPVWIRRRLAAPVLRRFGGALRMAVSGGSALDPEVGQKWEALGVAVVQGYGATECSPVISANRLPDRKLASVGRPLPSVVVRLAPDGEILVRGPNVVDGYYERPDETAERFRDGWYYTDDLGAFDRDGHLYIKGRKRFLIVTPAGENVYPEDVEAEFTKEAEVQDSAVVGWERQGRFEIHAVLLARPGVTLDAERVVERVNQRLQPHQRVQGVSVWDADDFPRTVTRKVKKSELMAWLRERDGGRAAQPLAVPAGAVERAIAQATGIPADQIRPEMRLERDLKLDSLGRVMLVSVIEEVLGVALDEGQVQPETSVAWIKEMVSRRRQKEERYELKEGLLTPGARAVRAFLQRSLLWPYLWWLAWPEVRGREHLAGLEGPLLFMPNHLSPVDGALALYSLPRRFHTWTAIAAAVDVLYEHPAVARYAWLAELFCNTYPFDREQQVKSALQYTGRLLDRGFSVILFPEGHMSRDGTLQEIKGGAGILAVESLVPVVPMAILGTDRIVPPRADRVLAPRRGRARIAFGKPLRFSPGTRYEDAAAAIHDAIARLQRELQDASAAPENRESGRS